MCVDAGPKRARQREIVCGVRAVVAPDGDGGGKLMYSRWVGWREKRHAQGTSVGAVAACRRWGVLNYRKLRSAPNIKKFKGFLSPYFY